MGKKAILFILISCLLVFLLWHFYPVLFIKNSLNITERGQHGDQYGGLNALFTGLAFVLLIATLLLQMIELGLQRKDIEDQSNIMNKQVKITNTQSQIMTNQLIIDSFFRLVTFHREMVSSQTTRVANGKGPEAFRFCI